MRQLKAQQIQIQNSIKSDSQIDENTKLSDCQRLKQIIDEIRPEVYHEFNHKITRTLEKIRRAIGEGKKRLVPAFTVAKTVISSADIFWEKAKLAERCVGRMTSKVYDLDVLIHICSHCREFVYSLMECLPMLEDSSPSVQRCLYLLH